jgi:hypothetical protein
MGNVLDTGGTFASSWLREKSVAPVPVGAQIDAALARRITAGCRAVGAAHIIATSLVEAPGAPSRLPADADCTGIRPPCLLHTPGTQLLATRTTAWRNSSGQGLGTATSFPLAP